MSVETHVNALLEDVEEAFKKAHGAIDDLRNATEKVKEYYRTHEPEVKAAEAAVESEAKQLEAGDDEGSDEEQENAGKQQANAKSK